LGGGQLGRMLCQAASQMAIKVNILDPLENCPASSISHYHMVGSFDDSATVEEFAKRLGLLNFVSIINIRYLAKSFQLNLF
jgi:phosphoribosylaminoimidazole carboxylase